MEAKVERILRLVNFKDGTPWGAGGGEGICRTCPADSNKCQNTTCERFQVYPNGMEEGKE